MIILRNRKKQKNPLISLFVHKKTLEIGKASIKKQRKEVVLFQHYLK